MVCRKVVARCRRRAARRGAAVARGACPVCSHSRRPSSRPPSSALTATVIGWCSTSHAESAETKAGAATSPPGGEVTST